jgi:hypothetical protein
VTRLELLDADDAPPLAGQIEESGAAHGAEPYHRHIKGRHRVSCLHARPQGSIG